jgi:CheY-like chemotaxis protein
LHRQGISVPKILVADDNTNIQKMVSLALEERGINVVSVGNGEAAVRRIPDLDPDLVLADIFMPVRNGYEVCEFVKKDERFAHVPVILLVGAFDPLDEKEARRVGADGVLKKPFVPPDPLIAMVTSALEKNPRVAAELAKAKEAKAAPQPEPMPSVEVSARPEPKPLPEFPEPSPEEAELVYGFGKGHRTLDSGEPIGANGEPPAPKLDASAQAADEEADEATTSSDWRRSAMDLEIPADLANQPAIPSMSDLEPINFPSEKDYPPRRVQVSKPVEEVERAAASGPTAENSFSLRQVEDSASSAADEAAALPVEPPKGLKLQTKPEPQPPVGVHPATEAPAGPQSLPEPNSTAAGGHWLDAVSGSQAGNAPGDWMAALVGGQAEPHAEAVEESSAPAESAYAGAFEMEESSAPEVAEQPVVEEPEASAADSSPELVQADEAQGKGNYEGDSFFAEEAVEEEVPAATSQTPETESEFFTQESGPAAGEVESEPDDSEPSPALKDPALVEPPAVHVTPEPLLVEEEASAPAHYGKPAEETAPLHSFLSPGPEIPGAESSTAGHPSAPSTTEFFVQPGAESSADSSAEEVNERIPTVPPPNREALADIAFLTPPPSFLAELKSGEPQQETRAADPATVDLVVQKVLDRLQPQLQELLSQGLLKPLVENIFQNEVDKKR